MGMRLSNYDIDIPEELIAKYPAEHRDESRLMVLNRKEQTIEHKMFKDLIDYFDEDDILVFNNTKVFPARLHGTKEKTNAKIEVFLLRELDSETRLWDVMVDPARKIRIGNKLFFGDDESLLRSEEHTSELQSRFVIVCRLLLVNRRDCFFNGS